MSHPWGYHYTLWLREPFRSECTNPLVDEEGVQVQVPSMVFDMWFQHMWTHILSDYKRKRKPTETHLSTPPFKILN